MLGKIPADDFSDCFIAAQSSGDPNARLIVSYCPVVEIGEEADLSGLANERFKELAPDSIVDVLTAACEELCDPNDPILPAAVRFFLEATSASFFVGGGSDPITSLLKGRDRSAAIPFLRKGKRFAAFARACLRENTVRRFCTEAGEAHVTTGLWQPAKDDGPDREWHPEINIERSYQLADLNLAEVIRNIEEFRRSMWQRAIFVRLRFDGQENGWLFGDQGPGKEKSLVRSWDLVSTDSTAGAHHAKQIRKTLAWARRIPAWDFLDPEKGAQGVSSIDELIDRLMTRREGLGLTFAFNQQGLLTLRVAGTGRYIFSAFFPAWIAIPPEDATFSPAILLGRALPDGSTPGRFEFCYFVNRLPEYPCLCGSVYPTHPPNAGAVAIRELRLKSSEWVNRVYQEYQKYKEDPERSRPDWYQWVLLSSPLAYRIDDETRERLQAAVKEGDYSEIIAKEVRASDWGKLIGELCPWEPML